jgi:hypothetical protein
VKNRLFVVLAVIAVFALTAAAIASFFLSPSPITAVPVFAALALAVVAALDEQRFNPAQAKRFTSATGLGAAGFV